MWQTQWGIQMIRFVSWPHIHLKCLSKGPAWVIDSSLVVWSNSGKHPVNLQKSVPCFARKFRVPWLGSFSHLSLFQGKIVRFPHGFSPWFSPILSGQGIGWPPKVRSSQLRGGIFQTGAFLLHCTWLWTLWTVMKTAREMPETWKKTHVLSDFFWWGLRRAK